MEEIKKIVDLKKSADFKKCVEVARLKFDDLFDHSIQNLLHIFPADHKDKDGQPFWSGPKRAPSAIHFDANDPLHVHFVESCANLIAFNLGIPLNRDQNQLKDMAASFTSAEFKPKKIKIALPGEENKASEPEEVAPEDEEVV